MSAKDMAMQAGMDLGNAERYAKNATSSAMRRFGRGARNEFQRATWFRRFMQFGQFSTGWLQQVVDAGIRGRWAEAGLQVGNSALMAFLLGGGLTALVNGKKAEAAKKTLYGAIPGPISLRGIEAPAFLADTLDAATNLAGAAFPGERTSRKGKLMDALRDMVAGYVPGGTTGWRAVEAMMEENKTMGTLARATLGAGAAGRAPTAFARKQELVAKEKSRRLTMDERIALAEIRRGERQRRRELEEEKDESTKGPRYSYAGGE